jgi:hypothetical protein
MAPQRYSAPIGIALPEAKAARAIDVRERDLKAGQGDPDPLIDLDLLPVHLMLRHQHRSKGAPHGFVLVETLLMVVRHDRSSLLLVSA